MPQTVEEQAPSKSSQLANSFGRMARTLGTQALKRATQALVQAIPTVGTALSAGIQAASFIKDPYKETRRIITIIIAAIFIIILLLVLLVLLMVGNGNEETPAPPVGESSNEECVPNPAPGDTLDHNTAAGQLAAAGIPITSTGNCSDKNISTCTSLDGVLQSTINGIIAFKQACGCNITVTGGTETGHAPGPLSHGSGHKIDISSNGSTDAVSTYIRSNFTYVGERAGSHGGPIYIDSTGNEYVFETGFNHWDILYLGNSIIPEGNRCSVEP